MKVDVMEFGLKPGGVNRKNNTATNGRTDRRR